MARIRATLVAIAVVAGVASGGLVAGTVAPVAGGASPHRAMVVVETGAATYHRVVTFASDSISGIKALELAGAQPVVYSFAGQGGAVCRLFGVGRDAGPNCLGGADGDNRYWAYFRAPAGSSSFTYSRAGAGSTQVHDGDVEGWKFGTGSAPAYVGLPPLTTATTRPAAPPPVGGSGGSGTPAGGTPVAGPGGTAVVPPTNLDPQALAAFLAAAATTTTTLSPPSANDATSQRSATQVEGEQSHRSASGPGSDGSGGGSGAGSLVLFAVVALALVGGGLLLRRSRRRPVP